MELFIMYFNTPLPSKRNKIFIGLAGTQTRNKLTIKNKSKQFNDLLAFIPLSGLEHRGTN